MQGRILIVDAIATNRIMLKVKLAGAFYSVEQAASVTEAVIAARASPPDLIISALELPDGGAAEICTNLKTDTATSVIPIMAVCTRTDREVRMAALEAGVHDILLKPLDDTLLLGRVRSLIRARNAASEWQLRDDTSCALGLAEPAAAFAPAGKFMLVSTDRARLQSWTKDLRPRLRANLAASTISDIMRALDRAATPDVFALILPERGGDAAPTLRLISALRANAATRHAGILLLQTAPDPGLAADALDLGADDVMVDGFDAPELALRLGTLLSRTRIADQLRATVRTGLQAAVVDPLTGLHNRRYAMPHLERVAKSAQAADRSFAVMVADLDHFKRINDLYGHLSGDAVLVETACRLRRNLRAADMIARIGGEEFLIVMPGTTMSAAQDAAIRLCDAIGASPMNVPGSATPIPVTISIGMAIGGRPGKAALPACEGGETLMHEADKALYAAKLRGRNQVTLGRPAA